jgi:hypothetical protein
MKKVFLIILSILVGLIFVFSAYVKLYPVELFELTFIDLGVANWFIAPFIARIMIAMEFFIGLLLISNLFLNKFTLRITIGVLLLFTIYLTGLIIVEGNSGNCKCFGNFISLTPLESIFKNIILIIISLIIYKFHKGIQWKYFKILFVAIILSSISAPFILNPIDISTSREILNESEINYKLDLDVLYGNPKVVQPKEDLRKGKHIIAFMSLSCPHCRIGAYKMYIIKKRNTDIPMFFVLNGKQEKLQPFFDDTKATNIPYTILLGHDFIRLAGLNLPAIFWVDNSIVVKRTSYFELDQNEIEEWLNK